MFATLASVEQGYGNLTLTPEAQADFLALLIMPSFLEKGLIPVGYLRPRDWIREPAQNGHCAKLV